MDNCEEVKMKQTKFKNLSEIKREIEELENKEALVDRAIDEGWIFSEKGNKVERDWLETCLNLDILKALQTQTEEICKLIRKVRQFFANSEEADVFNRLGELLSQLRGGEDGR